MRIFFSILFLALVFCSFKSWLSDYPDSWYGRYHFSSDIEKKLKSDRLSYEAAWDYSFIGEYQKALEAFDLENKGFPSLTHEQISHFYSFQPINASSYIVERAKNEKVIMINEAHHQPLHRVFTTSLLEGLYEKGYRYLGLEALIHEDSLINQRGYPLLNSGFYTKEPQFGNLIREAIKLGFEVFPYEAGFGKNGKEREIEQARNIQKMMEKHPDGKFLIHCGFDHINEADAGPWEKAMAGRLKEFTGIDPFTINQEILTERSSREKDNPFYLLADTLKESSIFIKEDGTLFRGGPGDERFDVRLFHPRTNYIYSRPDWLLMNGKRNAVEIGHLKINIEYPVLVKAYLSNESKDAVPMDIIELLNSNSQKALVLPKGEYRIEIENIKEQKLQYEIFVK